MRITTETRPVIETGYDRNSHSYRILETNRVRASQVVDSLESYDFSRNPIAAYAVNILHKSLQRAFFESDNEQRKDLRQVEIDELSAYYPQAVDRSVRCFIFDRLRTVRWHQFSPEEEVEIEKIIALSQSNAEEITRVVNVGEDEKGSLHIRIVTAVNFLSSSLARLAEIAKGKATV